LGIIFRNNYKSELALTTHPRSSFAESFRGVRTSLKYFFNNGKGNIVAVHSMVPGEGKTFTAINLSTVLAMNNHKVLLVGCDMRKPRLHDVFEVENNKGLSTYLINMDSLDEIITETNIDNLFFINSGPIPPNPAELLDRNEFNIFIAEVKKRFDYIVLDNAPVSLVTDGILIGKKVDLNLFVSRQDYTNKDYIKYVNKLDENKEIENIAFVLNDVKYEKYGSSFSKYGNRYYEEDDDKISWRKHFFNSFSKN
jgi:capsular exopolysaccharide synthesis family protein